MGFLSFKKGEIRMTHFNVNGLKLQAMLIDRRWGVRELARAADLSEGVTRRAVYYSTGQRFRPKTVFALAGALDVEPSAFASVEG